MAYIEKNRELLEEVHELLKEFPFSKEVEEKLVLFNPQKQIKEYEPYSEFHVDEYANAICWSCGTIISLLERKPVSYLDKVLSFNESLLNDKD